MISYNISNVADAFIYVFCQGAVRKRFWKMIKNRNTCGKNTIDRRVNTLQRMIYPPPNALSQLNTLGLPADFPISSI